MHMQLRTECDQTNTLIFLSVYQFGIIGVLLTLT